MARPKGAVGKLELWDELVGELYESVLNPGGLTATLKRIDTWMGSSFCHLMAWDDRNDQHHFSIVTDAPFENAVSRYSEYYGGIDPRRQYAVNQESGITYACHDIFDDSFVSRSEFYQDLLIPAGARYFLYSRLLKENGISAYLVFNHLSGQGHFSAEQKLSMTRLLPHMQRTIRIAMRNENFRAGLFAGEAGLDALDQAVYTIDKNNGIIFANRNGYHLLKANVLLKARGRQLNGCSVHDDAKLHAAFMRVRLSGQPETLALYGGGEFPRDPERTSLVTVLPVPVGGFSHPAGAGTPFSGAHMNDGLQTAGYPFVLSNAELVVLVTPQRRDKAISAASLKTLFGLTPAEARLAHQLAKGVSVEDYADAAAISVATVRTQLRSILGKTGESRLQDLVRMLGRLPALS
jgi:DNA-binding CsgD family transcriptional regulator